MSVGSCQQTKTVLLKQASKHYEMTSSNNHCCNWSCEVSNRSSRRVSNSDRSSNNNGYVTVTMINSDTSK